MINEQYISCPDCASRIPFDPHALVRGERFACPKCPSVSIGIDQGSQGLVKKTLDELEKLKKDVGSMKSEPPIF